MSPDATITIQQIRQHRADIKAILNQRKASNLRVFGSVAEGKGRRDSDVDFLVAMDPDATLIDLIGLKQDLAALLGTEVDVVSDDAIHPRLERRVRATAVPL